MQAPEKVAVVDVGSNSCRMVIYEQAGAALLPYFNEKAMAGLGRGLPETGRLSPDGRILALETFRRFNAILKGLGVVHIRAVATAAVRVASDGPEFRKAAEDALDVPLEILSGPIEGQFSARGVEAGFRSPNGLVADLGGSSLELQSVGKGAADKTGETYLLGPLARSQDEALSVRKRRKIVAKILAESDLLPVRGGQLYAVGGAWRTLATVHMELTKYPLGVIHGYTLDRKAIAKVISAMGDATSNPDTEARIRSIAKRRYDTLLHAAIVLDGLLELADVPRAHISAFGLREGVIAPEEMKPEEARLLDTTELYFKLSQDSLDFGRRLHAFLAPVLETIDLDPSVLKMICLMADAGARMHPDHRCDLIFEQVLRAPIPLLEHAERVFAAAAIAYRYSFRYTPPKALMNMLSPAWAEAARVLGTAMRLGGVYSGRSASVLSGARLEISGKALTLRVLSRQSDMVSDTVRRRHEQLASLMGLEPELQTDEAF